MKKEKTYINLRKLNPRKGKDINWILIENIYILFWRTFIFVELFDQLSNKKKTCVYFFIIYSKMLCQGQGSTTCNFYLI